MAQLTPGADQSAAARTERSSTSPLLPAASASAIASLLSVVYWLWHHMGPSRLRRRFRSSFVKLMVAHHVCICRGSLAAVMAVGLVVTDIFGTQQASAGLGTLVNSDGCESRRVSASAPLIKPCLFHPRAWPTEAGCSDSLTRAPGTCRSGVAPFMCSCRSLVSWPSTVRSDPLCALPSARPLATPFPGTIPA